MDDLLVTNVEAIYRQVVIQWLDQEGFTFDVSSNAFEREGNTANTKEIAAQVHLVANPQLRLVEKKLVTVVGNVGQQYRNAAISAARLKIMGYSGADAALRVLLRVFLAEDMEAEEFENCLTVMKQWLWLVKRGLAGRRQTYHMMPIIWSKQGGGKSTTLTRLLAPLGGLARKDDFKVFSDQFAALRMHYAFVIFLDEMGHAEKADAAVMKDAISSEHIKGRGMFSDEARKKVRNANFIAATNLPPSHGLYDTTGARRYFSLRARDERVTGDRAKFLSTFDPMAVWACVDVDGDAPYLERADQISAVQGAVNRATSTFEDFMAERVTAGDVAKFLLLGRIQQAYGEYLTQRRLPGSVPSQKALTQQLTEMGFEVKTTGNRPRISGVELGEQVEG